MGGSKCQGFLLMLMLMILLMILIEVRRSERSRGDASDIDGPTREGELAAANESDRRYRGAQVDTQGAASILPD